MTPTIDHGATIDLAGPLFAARLASMLRTHRRASGAGLAAIARASDGTFSVGRLEQIEAGLADLDDIDLGHLAELYSADVSAVLLDRVGLLVDLQAGRLQISGLTRTFASGDPDGMLIAYLGLVRDLRRVQGQGTIELRRHDIKILAATLQSDGPAVVARLSDLMRLSTTQRASLSEDYLGGAAAMTTAP